MRRLSTRTTFLHRESFQLKWVQLRSEVHVNVVKFYDMMCIKPGFGSGGQPKVG